MLCEVTGTQNAHLVGVVAARILHGQAILECLADIASVGLRKTVVEADQVVHDLETGELVVGRQSRSGFRVPLTCFISVNGSFFMRSCAHAASIGLPLLSSSMRKHEAVREVGIVRNRQQLGAVLALRIHPVPQIFGMIRIDRTERLLWEGLVQLLKNTFRCMFWFCGIEVHS